MNFKGREVLEAKSFKEGVKYKVVLCKVFGERADGLSGLCSTILVSDLNKKPSMEVVYIFLRVKVLNSPPKILSANCQ